MKQLPLRVGVIGFGKLGLLHAGVVNGATSAKLVAAADTSDTLIKAFKQNKPELAIYEDYERMLDAEALDAVFVTSPTHLHVPMALKCAEQDLPFFVEKPLGTSGDSIRPLLDQLKRKPLPHMVGYMGRYIDTFAKAKEILDTHPLGKLIHLRASMYVSQLFRRGKGWRYDKKLSGGGVLITQNSHLIDQLQWYFGRIAWVSGHVKTYYSGTVDDFAHAYFGFECGLTGFMDTSWSARHHRMVDIAIDVQGENGTLTVNDDVVKLFLDQPRGAYPAGWTTLYKPDIYRPVPIDVGGPQYTHQDTAFLEAVIRNEPLECDAFSAYHVQQVIDAIYESSAAGGGQVTIQHEV